MPKDFVAVPKVVLGDTGIETSRIGLGMASWPNRLEFVEVIEVLKTAFEIGIRHLDNAAKYNSEHIIGKALGEVDVPGDVVVATKVCTYHDRDLRIAYQSFNVSGVERSIERSLELLNRDHLDIVYVHDLREPNIPLLFAERGPLPLLQSLKKQGVIRAIGMATRDLVCLENAVTSEVFDLIQTFHVNTLLNQSAHRSVYPLAKQHGVPIMDSGPYAGYILATGPREGAEYGYRPASEEVQQAAGRLQKACSGLGVSLPDAAVAFALNHPDVKTLTIGSGNPKHIKGWTRALTTPLSQDDFQVLLNAAGGEISSRPTTAARFVDPGFST